MTINGLVNNEPKKCESLNNRFIWGLQLSPNGLQPDYPAFSPYALPQQQCQFVPLIPKKPLVKGSHTNTCGMY